MTLKTVSGVAQGSPNSLDIQLDGPNQVVGVAGPGGGAAQQLALDDTLTGGAAKAQVTNNPDNVLAPSMPAIASLVASTALSLVIPTGVKRVVVVNNTPTVVTRDYTKAATAGSPAMPGSGGGFIDTGALGGLTLSLFSASAATVNGTTANGITVEYWS